MINPHYEHWTDRSRSMGALPSPTLSPVRAPAQGDAFRSPIQMPQQGQAPSSPFGLPAGAGAAAQGAAAFAANAHAAYVAKVPPPFALTSTDQVKALPEPDRAKWLQWFMGSPAVSAYLDARKSVTEAASAYLDEQATQLRADLIIQALEGYKKAYYPQIALSKAKLYPAFEALLEQLDKHTQAVTSAASIQWDKALGGKALLPTPYDLYEGRVKKHGNALWATFYWSYNNTLVYPDQVSKDLSAVVPATALTLPVVTLPACGPLPQKTVGFFLSSNPAYWDTAGMGPRLKALVGWLKLKDQGGSFSRDLKTGEYKTYAVYQAISDWMAANLMDPLKALAFAQVFAAKGTPYSIGWCNDEIARQNTFLSSRKPLLAPAESAVAKADAQAKNLLKVLPGPFEQKMAAGLGDQMGLLVLSIVKNGIAKMLAEVAGQDLANNAQLVQLSAYGAELQIASKAEYKDAVYFVLGAATDQASAISEGVAGGQIQDGQSKKQGAADDLKTIQAIVEDTGVQTVSPEDVEKAKKAAEDAQKALDDAAKKKAAQDGLIKQIEDASKQDYQYQTVTPVVTSASPAKVPVAGGVQVAVQGLFFATGATAQLAGTDVPTVFVSPSQLTITVPAASGPGPVDLTITNPATTVTEADGSVYNKKAASATLKAALTYEQQASAGIGLPALAAVALGAFALMRK